MDKKVEKQKRSDQNNILLVQLAAFGDCLFVTTLTKQIKEIDFPGCQLTWLIGSLYLDVVKNNPYVDKTIEVPIKNIDDITTQRKRINEHIRNINENNYYDKIIITDYIKANNKNWYGTTRSSLFRCYPYEIKVDPQPLIYLNEDEINNAREFCKMNLINDQSFNILFEYSPRSGQSLMNFDTAVSISKKLITENKNIRIILSSNVSFNSDNPRLIDGSRLRFRENAELINHCHLFVGCSSGISWLITSNHSKKIRTIQIINPDYAKNGFSASVKTDFRYFDIDTSDLIELYNPSDDIIYKCIKLSVTNQFLEAQRKYDVDDITAFLNYRFLIESKLKNGAKLNIFMKSLFNFKTLLINYNFIKPSWFRPTVWINRIIKN